MVKGFYLAVVKELQSLGFVHTTNAKGSHEKWVRGRETLIVPRHLYTRPLANSLLKKAGSAKRV